MDKTWYAILITLCCLLLPRDTSAASPIKWAADPMPWPEQLRTEVHYTTDKYGWFLDRKNYYAIGDLSQDKTDPYIWYVTILEIKSTADPVNWKFETDIINDYQMTLDYQREKGPVGQFVDPPYPSETRQAFSDAVEGLRVNIEMSFMDTPILPWLKGTYATYGALGTHYYGEDNYPGWYAVDFVSGPYMGDTGAPNGFYAATDGTIVVLCSDIAQLGIRIGDFQYLHLVPNSGNIYTGKMVKRGDYLGQVVTGDNDTTCGYTDQADDNYHLHFGFRATELIIENYVFGYSKFIDQRDGTVYNAGDNLLAEWESDLEPTDLPPGVPPDYNIGTYGGDNFWDWLVGGFTNMSYRIGVSLFPPSTNLLPIPFIINVAAVSIAVVYLVAVVNFGFVMLIFGIIGVAEMVRLGMGLYKLVKSLIPIAG